MDGCHWACPYEYKFFDFIDPAQGWPELPIASDDGLYVEGKREPIWHGDNSFECFETDDVDKDSEATGQARTRLRRDDAGMIVVDQWASDAELGRRKKLAETEADFTVWRKKFCAENPLYLAMKEAMDGLEIPDDGLDGCAGVTMAEEERCVVKYFRRINPKASADLKWGVKSAPIEVTLYDEKGTHTQDLTFPYSVSGMNDAMARIVCVFKVDAEK